MKQPRPITVLFDANPMVASGKSGVGYFTYRLIAALAAEYPQELRLVGHYYNFLGRNKQLDLVISENVQYRQTKPLPGKVFNGLRRFVGIGIPLEVLARSRADVLLFPNFAIAPSLFRRPRIVAVYDLYFTVHPEHINKNNINFLQKFVPIALAKADLVMTISSFTQRAITDTFHVAPTKILTIPIPPVAPTFVTNDKARATLKSMNISKPYILFVGNLEPRKNLVSLIDAYANLPAKLRGVYSLVLAGGKGWSDEEIVHAISHAKQIGLDIVTPGYVSDEQKAALYQRATVLVMPSHYEGFGMQILEAMSYGIPVAVSDIPVFHEVAHDAAMYFNQNDPQDIKACIEHLLLDPETRARLASSGYSEIKKYHWNTVAKTVFARISSMIRG